MLSDGCRAVGCAQPQQRRTVRGRDDDDRSREPVRTEVVFEKRSHFAATFTDQREDDDVCLRSASHHAEQRALADAAATKETKSLTPSAGQDGVDGAHASAYRFRDWTARKRIE